MLGALVQRSVDGEDICAEWHDSQLTLVASQIQSIESLTDFAQELLQVINLDSTDLLLGMLWQRSIVVVCELGAVEWLQSLEDTESNSASSECADYLAFEVEGVLGDGSDVPSSSHDLLVGWCVVADQVENLLRCHVSLFGLSVSGLYNELNLRS